MQDSKELNTWALILHLSLLAGLLIPFAGLLLPIVVYMLKRDDVPGLEPHWHIVINWIISLLIYAFISTILIVAFGLGILLLWILSLLALIFPIIGAIKANDGEAWPYPLSIQFFGRS